MLHAAIRARAHLCRATIIMYMIVTNYLTHLFEDLGATSVNWGARKKESSVYWTDT